MPVARTITTFSSFWLTCLLLGMLVASTAAAEWEIVTQNRRDYVTLESLCRFYGFNYVSTAFDQSFTAKNKDFSLQIPRSDTREIQLNGINYWLSFPVSTNSTQWLISRADVAGLFEPVLRPHKIDGSITVQGVVIDPGHGGSDNGAQSSKGTYEKNYTLDTAFRLEKLLKEGGIKTVLTRRSDIFIPLEERVSIAARYRDYLFVSVHFNYAQRSARGLETYVLTPRGAGSTEAEGRVRQADYQRMPGNSRDPWNALLGHEVHRQIIKLNPGDSEADRGLKRARFVVLRDNVLPAVLVEGGFLTNRMEASLVDRPQYRQSLATAIARGVLGFIQKTNRSSTAEAAVTPPPPVVQPTAPVLSPSIPKKELVVSTPKPAPVIEIQPPPVLAKTVPPTVEKTESEPTVTIYAAPEPVPAPASPEESADVPKPPPTSTPTIP